MHNNYYRRNEVAADEKYKDKVIEVQGVVDNIGKDILNNPYVMLNDGPNVFDIQCIFDDSYIGKLSTLSKGQELTFIGHVISKFGNVILKDCSF